MATPRRTRAIPPEHALLLAAADGSEHAMESAEHALRAGPDWTRVIELALYHRLAAALLAVLEAADGALVPDDLLTGLRIHCKSLENQSDALLQEIWALLDALHGRSVVAVPFKGPLLAELLFGNARLRAAGDIDILIPPESVRETCAVLEERGFADAGRGRAAMRLTEVQRRLYEQFQCEYTFFRAADNIVVEPHWDLSQRPLAIDVDYTGMLDRARPAWLSDRAVLMLAPEDLLVALCVHGSKHHWSRLAWIRDIGAVLRRFPEIDIHRVLATARTRGYHRLLLLGLSIAHHCTAVPLPGEVIRDIENHRTLFVLERDILHRLFEPAREEPRNDRVNWFRLRMRERLSDRLRYTFLTLVTPRRDHLETIALPSALRWGYYPLKLGIDFACLPMWRVMKATRVSLFQDRS